MITPPVEEVFYIAELACMSCSRDQGEVRLKQPHQPIYIRSRCRECGGLPVIREITQQKRHLYDAADLFEKPRVGRPRKHPRVQLHSAC